MSMFRALRRALLSVSIWADVTKYRQKIDKCAANLELSLHNLRCIDAKSLRNAVSVVQGENCVAAHVAVAVIQIFFDGLHQRLQKLEFLQLGDKSQCTAAYKLVCMHQILAKEVAHKDHLFSQLARCRISLVYSFEVNVAAAAREKKKRMQGRGRCGIRLRQCTHTSFLSSWSSKGTQ
jgi:hypothetical protein